MVVVAVGGHVKWWGLENLPQPGPQSWGFTKYGVLLYSILAVLILLVVSQYVLGLTTEYFVYVFDYEYVTEHISGDKNYGLVTQQVS